LALSDLLRGWGRSMFGGTPDTTPSLAGYGALGKLIAGLPIADLLQVLEGRATIDTELDLAEKSAALIATAFPPGAIAAGEVELALRALQFLLDAAGVGPHPFRLQGGVPAGFPPGGGPGPYRGR
jgi:hypothetical protein